MTRFFTDKEFVHDVVAVQRAADDGPVVITDHDRPAYVLLRHDAYEKLVSSGKTILELLAQPGGEEFDFEPPRMEGPFHRDVDFS